MIPQLEKLSDNAGFSTGNSRWTRFVKDHLVHMRSSAAPITLDDGDRYRYKYRLPYLFSKYNINTNDAWIVMLLNGIGASEGLPEHATTILLPTVDYLSWLKNQFLAESSGLKKLS
jgi:hypothetical protein